MPQRECVIIGSGPAGLMAADYLSERGHKVLLCEKRRSPGWKILVAGASGLNVSYDCAPEIFAQFYRARQQEIETCLHSYGREQWLAFLRSLGEDPFLGTSRRYFSKNRKGSPLLRAWLKRLQQQGVEFLYGEEFEGFELGPAVTVQFRSGRREHAQTLLLALGGASWENETPPWPAALKKHGIEVKDFFPSNAGFEIEAPLDFFQRAEGTPIKGLVLRTNKGDKQGELMITKYGLEGTPIYTMGTPGTATLDLKPDLPEEKLVARIKTARGSLRKRVEFGAKLSRGAILLLEALSPPSAWADPESVAKIIKCLPVNLLRPRPLSEAISSGGGVSWDELEQMELKKAPGVFCAGEMIDWDAPTGGFMIQASVSTGMAAARAMEKKLTSCR